MTNISLLNTIIFPQKLGTRKELAIMQAHEMSTRTEFFVYVYFNNTGNYVADNVSLKHSDQTLITSFYKGEQL